MSPQIKPQRVLLTKIGLDGHDRGIKVVARGLRDAGHHVIYSGLWQSVEAVAQAAGDEDVDWLGVSIHSGAHMTLVPALLEALCERSASHVGVIVGGIIPPADQERLKKLGVVDCFGPGTSLASIVEFLHTKERQSIDQGLQTRRDDVPALARRLEQGDRSALARLLTLASVGSCDEELEDALGNRARAAAPIIAVTGSAGVGKSSLLGAVTAELAGRGKCVGVLACDPQSPVSCGALLGDRCRIASAAASDPIFIRSLSTAPGQQGVAPHIERMIRVMQVYGNIDRIFIETVGAGQGDVAIRNVADVVVVVLQPLTGDELQWEKAGILEVADVIVVNKGDLPGADRTAAEVTEQLSLGDGPRAAVVKTSVARVEGIEALCGAIEQAVETSRG
jgi:LAO/AO transport system ATPase